MDPLPLTALEEHVLDLLDRGEPLRLDALCREFPGASEADIQRVRSSAEILHAWLEDRGGRAGARADDGDWLAPGERIGGYVVLRRLPGGGMGQVYHAVQESLYPREVALKVHRIGLGAERELRRARREAEVASRLVHPHLVAVHDMGHDEERGLVYFSMQYVDGPDLRRWLRGSLPSTRADARRVVTRLSEVAGALAELHGRGYVHRDVKPENILLRRNSGRDGKSEAAVLVDFGLVRAERALRGDPSPSAAGTPGYAPPEAARGAAPTPAWDVYALGIVLRECTQDPDPDLAAVVHRATEAEPSQRYSDAAELRVDLERWLAGDFVAARRPTIHERARRTARRHPGRLALALVAVPVLLGGTRAATFAWDQASAVEKGAAAIDRGDLAAGWSLLESAHPLFVRVLAPNGRSWERDLVAEARTSPAAAVVHAEREHGRSAAFTLAAAHLERDGYQSGGVPIHPELQAFLLRNLAPDVDEETRTRALRAVTRLFFERPALTPLDTEATAPFRARLLEVLLDGASERDDLLHAASALGGIATPRELDPLLAWSESVLRDPEAFRTGLMEFQHVVRRTTPTGAEAFLGEDDWAALEERLAAVLEDARATPYFADGIFDIGPISASSAAAWALLHRRTGHALRLRDGLGAGWSRAYIPEYAAFFEPGAPEARSAILDRVREGPRPDPDHPRDIYNWAYSLGMSCAFFGEETFQSEVRALVHARGAADDFDRGWEDGRIEVEQGPAVKWRPDEQSLSRHHLDPATDTRTEPFVNLPPGDELASWKFGAELVRTGAARDAEWGGRSRRLLAEENDSYLRLEHAGDFVRAPIDVDDAVPELRPSGLLELVVVHQAASRPYLPYEGEVWVRIELDETIVADRLRVGNVGVRDLVIDVDRHALAQGRHILKVTVVEATTTYWIRELRVERLKWD